MVNCFDSDSYEKDFETLLLYDKFYYAASLKDSTFTGYSYDLNDQKMVSILDFDRSKVFIEQTDDNNFNVLYDNKPFYISIKAFYVLIKNSKDLT